jgi:glycosyltransferase involved in cell wall biosynthesis
MKILLIVNSDIGRSNTIGFRFGNIAEGLKSKNIEFAILARANYSDFQVKTPFYRNYLARFFNALRIYLFPFLNFRKFDVLFFDRFVLRQLKKMSDGFDLAHFGEYLPKSIKYLKNKGVRIFLDIPIGHHKYSQYLQEQGFKMDGEIGEAPVYLDKAINLSDVIVAPSLFVKKTLEMAGFFDKKIEIVPFGADIIKNFNEEDIKERNNNQETITKVITNNQETITKKTRFIFSGAVNYRKGINFLLKAWNEADLEGAELLICGRVYKTIKQEIKKYKNNNVKFLGFVNVKEYLKKSHVFVFPTLLEGSAKSVYEAMSCGLPVITTENAGSIVKDGEDGFIINIGDVEALREKISYFYNNHNKIEEMGISAFQKVKQYTWENYGKNVVNLYLK